MAVLSKVRRLVNPGRQRRNGAVKRVLSPLQKLFFGSKRQRAAVKKRNSGSTGKLKRRVKRGYISKTTPQYVYKRARSSQRALKRSLHNPKRRKRNVGSIVTVWPLGHANPGRKSQSYRKRKKVFKTSDYGKRHSAKSITRSGGVYTKRRKRNSSKRVVVINKGEKMAIVRRRKNRSTRRRARRNYGTKVGRSWSTYTKRRKRSNPGRRRRVYSRRRRHSNPSVRRHTRRRNPGVMSGTLGRVLGVVGGIATTKLLMGFVPAQFTTGVIGYLATGVVAVAQGKLVGKISKSPALGNDFMIGGFALLAAKVLNDFFPSIGGYTGISGMGLIGPSSFYVPQVNQNGSMGQFVLPAAVSMGMPQPAPASGNLGRLRRTGRVM